MGHHIPERVKFLLHNTEVHYAPHHVKIKSDSYLASTFQNLKWKNGPSYLAHFDIWNLWNLAPFSNSYGSQVSLDTLNIKLSNFEKKNFGKIHVIMGQVRNIVFLIMNKNDMGPLWNVVTHIYTWSFMLF